MTPVCYVCQGPHDPKIMAAFSYGAGGSLQDIQWGPSLAAVRDRPAAIWGILRGAPSAIREWKRQKRPFIYIDHGYIGRGHYAGYYRCTWNAFQQAEVIPSSPDRFRALGRQPWPWQRKKRQIIICPPSQAVGDAEGIHVKRWLDETWETLREHTDRPILVRRKDEAATNPLVSALRDAHAVVTYTSNVAIEAALYGVPVFVDPTSAAAPIGLTDLSKIETPIYPDRAAWLWSLAYGQFTLEEMTRGIAWKVLQERMPGVRAAAE